MHTDNQSVLFCSAILAMALQVGTSLRRSRTLQQHTRRLLAPRPTGPRPAAANVRKVHDTSGVASQNGADDDDEKTTSLEAIHLAIVQQKRIPHLMPTSDHHSGNDDRYCTNNNYMLVFLHKLRVVIC